MIHRKTTRILSTVDCSDLVGTPLPKTTASLIACFRRKAYKNGCGSQGKALTAAEKAARGRAGDGGNMSYQVLRRLCGSFAALAFTLSASTNVFAADVAMPMKAPVMVAPVAPAWTFSLTPYFWAPSLNGSTTVKGRTTDINASFIDILDHTQFPKGLFELAAFGEARYGRLGLLADITYLKLGLGAGISHSRGNDEVNAAVGVSAGLTVEMVIAELAAAYEFARWNGMTSPASTTALDLYAGGRVWWQHGDAQFLVSGTVNIFDLQRTREGTLSATGDVSWVDPVVGARLRHQFAPAWNLVVSGDVGGFGVGSKFSWQAIAALDYEFSRTKSVAWSGMLGYKALSVDYSKGSGLSHYEYDMTMYGPIFGITARF